MSRNGRKSGRRFVQEMKISLSCSCSCSWLEASHPLNLLDILWLQWQTERRRVKQEKFRKRGERTTCSRFLGNFMIELFIYWFENFSVFWQFFMQQQQPLSKPGFSEKSESTWKYFSIYWYFVWRAQICTLKSSKKTFLSIRKFSSLKNLCSRIDIIFLVRHCVSTFDWVVLLLECNMLLQSRIRERECKHDSHRAQNAEQGAGKIFIN